MSIEQYLRFLGHRNASGLESTLVTEPSSDDDVTVRLTVTTDARTAGIWLEVPRSLGSRRFRRVAVLSNVGQTADDSEGDLETRQVDRFGREYLLIPLEEGRQRLEVEYR